VIGEEISVEQYCKPYSELDDDELLACATEAAKIRHLKSGLVRG
jgi:hypothetical protein